MGMNQKERTEAGYTDDSDSFLIYVVTLVQISLGGLLIAMILGWSALTFNAYYDGLGITRHFWALPGIFAAIGVFLFVSLLSRFLG